MRVHVCSFASALDDLPKRLHRNHEAVLEVLTASPRFSTFEVTPALGRTLNELKAAGRIEYDHSEGYPWSRVVVFPPPGKCEACDGQGSTPIIGKHRAVCVPCGGNGWIRLEVADAHDK